MKTLLKSLAFLAVATLAGTAFGYGIGDSFFYFNGTRYTGSNPYEESAGYADGAELGEITELTIGAELIVDFVDGDSIFDTEKVDGRVTQSVTATIDTSYVTEKFFKAAIGAPQTEDPWEEPGEEE